jgi:hypothetical protein
VASKLADREKHCEAVMEYAVLVETHDGIVRILMAGFPTEDDANDFPVRLCEWKRVWVEVVPSARSSVPAGVPGI